MLIHLLAASLAFGAPVAVPMAVSTCSALDQATGLCTISNSGSTVDIGASQPGGPGATVPRSGGGNAETESAPQAPVCDLVADPLCREPVIYTVAVLRPTLADVASFAPAASLLADEPDGVGIVGMPMNFVVSATPHTATGTLFDLPVTVRFVPASFVFVHGDGTSRTSATGGQSWAALGQAQFSATATSHAYAARGTYGAAAIVQYAATVDFGSGDVSVPGLLEVRTPTSTIEVVEVRTALVDRTCLESPGGPGC